MAHLHTADISWTLEGDWASGRYSRAHTIRFDGGVAVLGSASTSVVPKPMSREDAVDPEELLVASLSACHMLTFLDLARHAGVAVTAYDDRPEGSMSRREDGRWWLSDVALRPRIVTDATPAQLADLHHRAHDLCFIANSVKTFVHVEPAPTAAPAGDPLATPL